MEPEALQWLTWTYARRLYDHVTSNDTLTFKTWSLFHGVYPNDIKQHATFRFHEVDVHSMSFASRQLPSIVDRLSRLDVSMLTFLSIRCHDLIIEDLAALTKINSLAVLALRVERVAGTYVDPIRDWGRIVHESGAFQKLRVLFFYSPRGIQRDSLLKHIASFKALNLVGIYDHNRGPDTIEGWMDWSTKSPQDILCVKSSPSAIWDDREIGDAIKTRQLYDLSLTLSKEPHEKNAYRSLAMIYDAMNGPTLSSSIKWFFREPEHMPGQVSKRPLSNTYQDERRDGDGKKKKLRANKKVDVDSLLGSFA
ncbi:hypothetical protein PtrSN002B_006483 [Pyrenophora tritici-repentis]|uniref:Uncharacterized protein n=2 Tax=Pyrenophora tritici-repentis TaxID=45151 RepID=A0A2W1G1M1_9PLEO|nr:uncharacterized protein PTRG_03248 [Pyrenophora tritici-repentis Pt-1C-BFP]KAF7575247.1 hypothetical protein PtrM4_068710 [Pyrenophora tritici-repentis]EDU45771.1 conserved hypothetical protein [Pyrenophora tritici-repentis Pt-1C-BFP]KAG9385999.1 hypothetical protein A1F94_002749 [Pyrenophora tritici-repentis]KAI0582559.1 hypothetical protein Alg215_04070 [Pyrenophora tritici-repentis]KAI0587803.1 hypothetical protein Alg130_03650 [Pyrenophora tritici-repentis]